MHDQNKDTDIVKQPLMSTGTDEPGFEANDNHSEKSFQKPKVGETVVGERKDT